MLADVIVPVVEMVAGESASLTKAYLMLSCVVCCVSMKRDIVSPVCFVERRSQDSV